MPGSSGEAKERVFRATIMLLNLKNGPTRGGVEERRTALSTELHSLACLELVQGQCSATPWVLYGSQLSAFSSGRGGHDGRVRGFDATLKKHYDSKAHSGEKG